jgi:predicted TIM-barrel fold metal-dependent hydrolase
LSFASPIDVQTHVLPPTPETAAGEIERAIGLGLDGMMMYSNVARRSLDEPAFRPVFEAAAAAGAAIAQGMTNREIADAL